MPPPEETAMPTQAARETASPEQVKFIRDLLAERQGVAEAEKIRTRLNKMRDEGKTLSKLGARHAIEQLKAIPKVIKADPIQYDPQAKQPVVAEGFYAVPSPNDEEHPLRFYRVRHGDGRWEGWTFVDVQASDEFHGLSRTASAKVLEAIAADPEAGPRYGQTIGRCWRCRRTLTDEESRRRGIGPDCAAKG
jgi:hypothetical protein